MRPQAFTQSFGFKSGPQGLPFASRVASGPAGDIDKESSNHETSKWTQDQLGPAVPVLGVLACRLNALQLSGGCLSNGTCVYRHWDICL